MKYSIIRVFHLLLKNLSIQYILFFAYPIGLIYYLITPLSNLKLSRRKQYIKNYSVLSVKINYVKYWLETIWLTKNGYFKYVYSNVKIINENAIRKLNKTHSSYILALPHVGNWEFAIPMGKELNLNLVAVAEPLSDIKILNWFTNLREELGCKILLGGKGQNTFSEIVELLNSNNHVCLFSNKCFMIKLFPKIKWT